MQIIIQFKCDADERQEMICTRNQGLKKQNYLSTTFSFVVQYCSGDNASPSSLSSPLLFLKFNDTLNRIYPISCASYIYILFSIYVADYCSFKWCSTSPTVNIFFFSNYSKGMVPVALVRAPLYGIQKCRFNFRTWGG